MLTVLCSLEGSPQERPPSRGRAHTVCGHEGSLQPRENLPPAQMLSVWPPKCTRASVPRPPDIRPLAVRGQDTAGERVPMTCSRGRSLGTRRDSSLASNSWHPPAFSGVCSTVTQSPGARGSAVDDSGIPVPLNGIQGAPVLFQVIRNPELPPEFELEKMSWGVVSRSNYIVMLHVFPGRDVPEWVNFQDKFKKRVHVLNTTTLRIDNLTLEDSGLYRARQSYTRGRQYDQDFHLMVYEPVPLPQIQATVLSLTPGWCNITMECNTTETREDLRVSWESEGLPRELEQRPAPGPAPNPWTLAATLPLSRPSPSFTCVVSNQADKKTASQDLGDVCGHDPTGEASAVHEGVIPWIVVPVLGVLGALL
ncbi:T-lymphocyte surface antigen Ly-9-like [Enhydra lutris kenyoni]|uniref:T-lymphocyte surface antigen Ly-9-like n=1 Tax=Enhydra lutris kenyoni TaxID=391180 RepID=A0A2Y9IQQ4_ENHLU|nr:T-lymphocyte surface antigen Ly-9-like [Enhydra lutris kenyoni]